MTKVVYKIQERFRNKSEGRIVSKIHQYSEHFRSANDEPTNPPTHVCRPALQDIQHITGGVYPLTPHLYVATQSEDQQGAHLGAYMYLHDIKYENINGEGRGLRARTSKL